jgi:excisionase family DNA binding protein
MTARLQTYSEKEAAALLGVSTRTLRRAVKKKLLRKTKVEGRTMFRETEIEKYLERRTR